VKEKEQGYRRRMADNNEGKGRGNNGGERLAWLPDEKDWHLITKVSWGPWRKTGRKD
jgi:hypothetical protein